ncbi:permease prefix domain 1-containing protein [Microbacterium abyssi]|uniref:permease prefix domain 1-containing protein n=1 Tax=Microbacterium abyssi TaxID=2782166 RepID=UPI001889A1BB|nr:permease prefix domain 1-containing protein [Microbacterium sp. A18JL241]
MAATLTERYISAVTKSLNPEAQSDVRAELEASIGDAVEARTDQGEPKVDAERTVLTELGDPAVLAAGYADRPLHLIGPKYYLTWWRLLKLLWIIGPICAAAGVTIANMIVDKPVGEIIGQFFVVGITTIVHIGFWTTLVFFILERTGADTGVKWSVDSLPEPQETGAGRGDLIASLVFLGIMAGVLLWDRFIGFVLVSADSVDVGIGLGSQTSAMPILNPELWPWWIGGGLILMGVEAALAIAIYAGRGWRPGFAMLNTVLAIVFAAGALYLLISGRLLNPDFLDFTLGRADVPSEVGRILAVLLAVVIVGVAVWDIIDGWLKTRRAQRAVV